jgi:hypothetical protein
MPRIVFKKKYPYLPEPRIVSVQKDSLPDAAALIPSVWGAYKYLPVKTMCQAAEARSPAGPPRLYPNKITSRKRGKQYAIYKGRAIVVQTVSSVGID